MKRRYGIALIGAAILVPASFAVAQSGAGVDESLFLQVWEAAKVAGPFGTALMAFVWWRTDAERKSLLDESNGRLERMIESMNKTAKAIEENTKALLFMGGRREV